MKNNQRVRLVIEPMEPEDVGIWLDRVQALHRDFLGRRGPLPESTTDIAEDRNRDV